MTGKASLLLVLLIVFACATPILAQDYERRISISEWIAEMENSKDSVYYLYDTEVYFDDDQDSLYSWQQPRTPEEDTLSRRDIHIRPMVVVESSKLPTSTTIVLSHLIFHQNITFSHTQGASQTIFFQCTFEKGLDLINSELGTLQFTYSEILQRVAVAELEISLLSFSNCKLSTDASVVRSSNTYGFERAGQNFQYLFFLSQTDKKINVFHIGECTLLPTEVKPVIAFQGGLYDMIYLDETDFKETIIDFIACSVKESLAVQNCHFNQPIGAQQFSFPLNNTSFYWGQLDTTGLGLYYDYSQPPVDHQTDSLASDIYVFNALKGSYSKFHSMYRTQGDLESANAAYIQMKDMETGKYRYLYQQDADLQAWFNWRFNQFLKYFSAYGTHPVQSLIFSMWTILLFAALYFFFPSDWDKINRAFLIQQHRKIMQYFSSEQKLEDFYTESHQAYFDSFEAYKRELKDGKGELPGFILAIGRPLYLLSVIKHRFLKFIYRRIEVLKGRWKDLRPKRKAYVSLVTVVSLLLYASYLIAVRSLNSITLSINVFSTLGFGAIPVKGVTRYITIVEGFIGWFLLSIFSVSLIGQMLQS